MSAEVFKLVWRVFAFGGLALIALDSQVKWARGRLVYWALFPAIAAIGGYFQLRRQRTGLRTSLAKAFGLQEVAVSQAVCPTLAGAVDGVPVEVQFLHEPERDVPRLSVVAVVKSPGIESLSIAGRETVGLDVMAAYDQVATGDADFDAVVRVGGDTELARRLVGAEVRALLRPLCEGCGASLLRGELTAVVELDKQADLRVPSRITDLVAAAKALQRAGREVDEVPAAAE